MALTRYKRQAGFSKFRALIREPTSQESKFSHCHLQTREGLNNDRLGLLSPSCLIVLSSASCSLYCGDKEVGEERSTVVP